MIRSWIGWIVTIAVFLSPQQARAQDQTLVLEGGTLIDGTGSTPINDAVVVIEGSRIQAVGTRGQVSYPQGARVISTEGRTILPGLVDGHVHLFADFMPQMFLRYGVTTVGETNNQTDWILLQRAALNSGKLKGPRMFVSGSAAGGPTDVADTEGRLSRSVVVSLKTPEEARAYVRKLVAMGVDMIKTNYTLTYDQLAAIVDEAAKAGVPVVGHSRNMRKAAELGLQYMEHMNTVAWALLEDEMGYERWQREGYTPERFMDTSLFPPLIELMVEKGVFINPTLVANWGTSSPRAQEKADAAKELIKDPVLASMVSTEIQGQWINPGRRPPDPDGYQKVQEFMRQYVDAGGKLLAATDEGGQFVPGLSIHYEMQMITDAGIAPMKAIQGATLWAAESIGQGENLGSIEVGKLADFTIIEGDPLNDITATRNVSMVVKDGKVLDTSYDPRSVTQLPRPYGRSPVLLGVNPRVTPQGVQSVTLELEGSRFSPTAVVRVGNADVPTQFVSNTQLVATVDSSLFENPGSFAVYVLNPGSTGSVSNSIFLFVDSTQ